MRKNTKAGKVRTLTRRADRARVAALKLMFLLDDRQPVMGRL